MKVQCETCKRIHKFPFNAVPINWTCVCGSIKFKKV